jgi:hypothetical protein
MNELLKKYYSSYLEGKKNLNIDNDKAYDYFKNSLTILEDLKKYKYDDLIKETEEECKKYLIKSVEYYLDSEIQTRKPDYKELYKSIKEGNINTIKKYDYGVINWEKLINNEDTLLHYAIKMGDTGFLKHAFRIGASIDIPNGKGNSLLEFACLEQDPNMINFLINNGANMKKYLFFRDKKYKFFNVCDSIDCANLIKIIITTTNININSEITNKIEILYDFLNLEESIGINDYTVMDLLNGLLLYLSSIDLTNALSYLDIIIEELKYDLKNKLGCPKKKIDLLLIYLVPFINYQFNVSCDWVISLELKYIILKLINKNKNINPLELKKELVDLIWDNYIKKELLPEDYIGTLVSQWITKIKV